MTALLPIPVLKRSSLVALVGNPNTGKSTLFTALTGFRQRIGNYPGVTVEKRTGVLKAEGHAPVEIVDLPGAYSLAATSADEAIVLDLLLGQQDAAPPDLIVLVVDAAHLAQNLFLTSQVLELGRPVVVALNMTDLAFDAGLKIDEQALAKRLGCPVVPIVANKCVGIERLTRLICQSLDVPVMDHCPAFPACVCAELDGLTDSVKCQGASSGGQGEAPRVQLLQTLLDPGGYHEQRMIRRCGRGLADELVHRRERIRAAGESIAEVEARIRYAWIHSVLGEVITRERPSAQSRSEAVDRWLTHHVVGLLVFLVIMGFCFQAVYTWAAPVMDAIDGAVGALGAVVSGMLPEGAVRSLIVDGAIAGVGAVLVFLPQILILFLFIAILEDCGYMARAAFLMDRWMALFGLGGKSFIPLLSSFACAVPGIMATRTIENRRDRLLTILIAPLMSCSARLPVYVLLIAAFIPPASLLGGLVRLQALVLLAMYLVGAVVAIPVALLLKRTVLKGPAQSFLLELPTYKRPSSRIVLHRMYEQGRAFAFSAGTIIFAVAIVIWALGYFPRPAGIATEHERQRIAAQVSGLDAEQLAGRLDEIDRSEAGAYLRQSLLGRMGHWIEPAVRPLGWDWRIGTAAIAAFPAREVVIATMGTIYNLGGDQDETSTGLREKLRSATWPDGRPVYNAAVALSIMVFFALCCQCGATLAIIRRETNSWRWPVFTFVYMTGLAYVGAMVTYQVAIRFVAV